MKMLRNSIMMLCVCALAACASPPTSTGQPAPDQLISQVKLICPVATVVVNDFASGQIAMSPGELATFQKDAPIVTSVCSNLTAITDLNAQNLLQATPELLGILTTLPGLSPQAKNNLAALDLIVTVIVAEAKANAPSPVPVPTVTPAATTQ